MKIALISDIHFGVRKNNQIFLQSQLKFFKDCFIPYLQKENIENIFFLGDLFDNRNFLHIQIKNEVFDLFENYLKNFNITLLVGNHDSFYTSTIKINSLKFLSKFENIKVIESIKTIELFNKNILLVPWITNYEELFENIKKYSFDVVLGHFEINGFKYNKNVINQNGLSKDIFSNIKKVFSGHFHIRSNQKISDNSEIIYIGSPFQMTRHDINEERGFTVLDLNTLNYKNINNDVSLKYKQLLYPESFSQKDIEGNIVDVHIKIENSYNEKDLNKYTQLIESYNPASSPNIFIDNDEILVSNLDDNYQISSMVDLIKDYVDSLNIENKDNIYNKLINLYNEMKKDL
jgi:DNA repair exonuclease SbcCD nuclease subunit